MRRKIHGFMPLARILEVLAVRLSEELTLLVKSRYPVIYVETPDESYAFRHLKEIADLLHLLFYHWSVTDGLRRGENKSPYYQTNDPVSALKTILDLTESAHTGPGLFVLKDLHRHLKNEVVLRLFKDLALKIKDTRDTAVIVAPEYELPGDLAPYTGHIIGGFPDEAEISGQLMEIIDEMFRDHRQLQVRLTAGETSGIVAALKGLTLQQIRNVISQALLDDGVLSIGDLAAIEDYKRRIFDQEGFLEFHGSRKLEEIAGFANLKGWLAERASSFAGGSSPLPPPKGLLLMGVQGCGKSLAVKVIAGALKLPLYQLDLGRLYTKYIGETEGNMRKALAIAEKLAPMCLWIDEIEKGFAAAAGGDVDGGVSQRVLGGFLTWLQEKKSRCFVAATANDIHNLPPEFLRKGRFDEVFFVDLPGPAEREAVFRIHLEKRGLDPGGFDLAALVERSVDFSGAEIEQVIIAALYSAAHGGEQLTTAHILAKIDSTKPLSVMRREEIEALREWARERTVPA